MENCVFCKIARGEIPSSKVYEDDFVLAFLDLNPASPGHALVIPKKHAATLLDLDSGTGDALLQAMRKIGKALRKVVQADGFNCIQNNFSAAGQEVMHLHWHVIPRHAGDQVIQAWQPGKYADMEEMAVLAGKLKAEM